MSSPALHESPVGASTTVGFKDWALVCAALGHGRQSIILRKGGIAEGRDGFQFKHEAFWLFPTQFHQQAAMVRPDESARLQPDAIAAPGTVEIRYLFVVECAGWVTDWATAACLEPFHVWNEDVIRQRFDYDETAGLQYAFGRVWRLETPWSFPDRPAFGGCRSWVSLPEPPAEAAFLPVIDDASQAKRARQIRDVLGEPNTRP